jgi:AcrR family transcriptional regulator
VTSGTDTRERILDATATLMRRQGYAATGIKQIVAEAAAPMGSLYHYFPNGKVQIAAEALARVGERIRRTMAGASSVPDLSAAIGNYFSVNAQRLADSNYERGCPIAVVCLEISNEHEQIRQVCEDVFEGWLTTLGQGFVVAGIPEADARDLATFVLSTYEGALTLSRARRDIEPMLTSGAVAASLLRARLVAALEAASASA